AQKWESKYGYAIKSWRENWDELTVFFDFPLEIRKIIYVLTPIKQEYYSKFRLLFMRLIFSLKLDAYLGSISLL
ncbi:hypothetical protein LIT42_12525, partial [Flavobacterium psychrophilum]|nr:hypothetical protein [Flavobacterium psychrophilum]